MFVSRNTPVPPKIGSRLLFWALLGFATLNLIYVAIGRGIPYGYDRLETYFTYLSAWNSITFEKNSHFLMDLAASPNPNHHPFYYTHHPNLLVFLVAQGLVRMNGAIEAFSIAAVIISTFSMVFAAKVLRNTAGLAVAVTYVILSTFLYLEVAVWAHDFARCFHFLLFWGSAYATLRYLARPNTERAAICLAAVWVACLNDFGMGLVVMTLTLSLILFSNLSISGKKFFILGIFASATLSCLTWFGILVSELGINTVLQDIQFTYLARHGWVGNSDEITQFYRDKNIAFWGVLRTGLERIPLFWRGLKTYIANGIGIYAGIMLILISFYVALKNLFQWRLLISNNNANRLNQDGAKPCVPPPSETSFGAFVASIVCSITFSAVLLPDPILTNFTWTGKPLLHFLFCPLLAYLIASAWQRSKSRQKEGFVVKSFIIVAMTLALSHQLDLYKMAPAKLTSAAKMASVSFKGDELIAVENVHPIVWYYTRAIVIPSPNLQLATSGKPFYTLYYSMLRDFDFDKSHRAPDYVACVRLSVQALNTCTGQEVTLRTSGLIEPSLIREADSFIAPIKLMEPLTLTPK